MDKNRFLQALDMLDIKYDKNVYEQFELYTNYLLEYNEKVNLTAIKEKNDIYLKHYLDSLSVLKYFDIKQNSKAIDIGTGAGFPAIPVKIIRKDIQMDLVDSLNKRIIFLQNLIQKLNLENINPIHSRAEELANNKDYRQMYDICLSRAVANMSTLAEYCTPFLKKGGYLLCLKGQNVDEEIKTSQNAMKKLNCKIVEKIIVSIPFSDLNHNIIVVEKIGPTPKEYPRKSGIPSKNPL